jgi:hypothetical protein
MSNLASLSGKRSLRRPNASLHVDEVQRHHEPPDRHQHPVVRDLVDAARFGA